MGDYEYERAICVPLGKTYLSMESAGPISRNEFLQMISINLLMKNAEIGSKVSDKHHRRNGVIWAGAIYIKIPMCHLNSLHYFKMQFISQ